MYLPLRRSNLPSLFTLFDFGDAATSNETRTQTNVAPPVVQAGDGRDHNLDFSSDMFVLLSWRRLQPAASALKPMHALRPAATACLGTSAETAA